MSTLNYAHLKDIILSADNFDDNDLNDILREARHDDCDSYHLILVTHSKLLLEKKHYKESKIYYLLSWACSMMLYPVSANEPFRPWHIRKENDSTFQTIFSENDFVFFEGIIDKLSNYKIKARLADICWFNSNPRKTSLAIIAIDSYKKYKFDDYEHPYDCKDIYERAIYLCTIHGKITQEKLLTIHRYLIGVMKKHSDDASIISVISDLLIYKGVRNDAELIYSAIIKSADKAAFDLKRKLLRNALEIVDDKKVNDSRVYELHSMIAKAYIEQAKCSPPMFAGDNYHKAVLEFRKIPKRFRTGFISDEEYSKLLLTREDANHSALGELTRISSPSFDITKLVSASKKQVSGKEMPEVLFAFAKISSSIRKDKLKEEVIRDIKKYPLASMFQGIQYASDGRVTAKYPGLSNDDSMQADERTTIWHGMMEHYQRLISLTVVGSILPALDVINSEHYLTLESMIQMCSVSHIVPTNKVLIWAKGIHFGFDKDFLSSAFILTPQIEDMVRVLLKKRGINTIKTDDNGIDTELGLSSLLNNRDITKAIPDDLLFEFQALYTDNYGFNLRHDIAHGLVNSNIGNYYSAIYSWWLCFRLVILCIPPENSSNQ